MYLNRYKTREALPLRSRRIWLPPIFRRFSGSNAAGAQVAIRRCRPRMCGVISTEHPLEYPAKLPGKFPAIAGKLFSNFQSFLRHTSEILSPERRRTTANITHAIAGYLSAILPSYASR